MDITAAQAEQSSVLLRVIRGFHLNLRGNFVIAAVIVIILTAAAIHVPWTIVSRKSVNELAEQINHLIATDVASQVDDLFVSTERAQRLLHDLIRRKVINVADKSNRDQAFLTIVQSQPHFSFVSYGDGTGDYLGAQRVGGGEFRAIESRWDAQSKKATRSEDIYTDRGATSPVRNQSTTNDFYSPDRNWYKAASGRDGISWTSIYIFANTGRPGLNSAMALREDGKIRAVTSIAIELDRISAYLDSITTLRSGTAFIATPDGELIAARKRAGISWPDTKGQKALPRIEQAADPQIVLAATAARAAGLDFAQIRDRRTFRAVDADGAGYLAVATPAGHLGWVVVTIIPESDFFGEIERYQLYLAAALVGALLVSVVIASLLAGRLTKPLQRCIAAMEQLAKGDLTIDVPGVERQDEIGSLARALDYFRLSAEVSEELRTQQVRDSALRQARLLEVEKATRDFDGSTREVIAAVSRAVEDMQATANTMASNATQTSHQAAAVADASQQTSANVRSVSRATEDLSESSTDIGRQVAEAAAALDRAVLESQRTNTTVKGLAEAAARIGEVVALINDIAGQTNLLALNATIEAARAGEAGKGFAVVAGEVKNLASQTAKATEDIQAQVAAIQAETGRAVEAIGGITSTIDQISGMTRSVVGAVDRQGEATRDIARNVDSAARRTDEVATNISGVTNAARETGAAAAQVQTSAGNLATQSQRLRGEIDRFIRVVTSA